ncbi:50S ribosome-binding GTPase [Candidatus Woesearchaeota archaeon]|nr:50S ribosome-binding GTPase [Candidatus Woesearchaeota archaeon]
MNFQSLPVVENPQTYLDKAFSRARKRADTLADSVTRRTDRVLLQKKIAHEKLTVVRDVIGQSLERLIREYPDFAGLPEFYEELARTQLDLDEVQESLGRLQGLADNVRSLTRKAQSEVRATHDPKEAKTIVDNLYGRLSALFKRSKDAFAVVERARRVLTSFPALKDGLPTVALAGFPNVGKSTLLSRLTSSTPKIAAYAFTTKTLNVGYYPGLYEDVQVVDTPGALARFERMNAIEQQAYLCLKYVADVIVMVFDPTDTYPLEDQERLLEQLKEHGKPIVVYLSKTDIADKGRVEVLKARFDAYVERKKLLSSVSKALEES